MINARCERKVLQELLFVCSSRKLEEIYGGNHTVGDLAPFSLGQTSLVNTTVKFNNKTVAEEERVGRPWIKSMNSKYSKSF